MLCPADIPLLSSRNYTIVTLRLLAKGTQQKWTIEEDNRFVINCYYKRKQWKLGEEKGFCKIRKENDETKYEAWSKSILIFSEKRPVKKSASKQKGHDSEEFINEVIDSEHLREFIRQWGNYPCRETIKQDV